MGLMGSWAPFFGINNNPAPKGKFNLYERSNTSKLKQGVKSLSRLDRQKFVGMIKEEGKWNKTVSNRQLIDMMRRRREPLAFRKRIKEQLLTHKPVTGMSEEQIARNVRLTTFDRIRDESKFGEGKTYKTGLVGVQGQGTDVSPTAIRPGATRSPEQDKKIDKANQGKIYRIDSIGDRYRGSSGDTRRAA